MRRVATNYLAGRSPQEIARRLNTQGVPTPGRSTRWHASTVRAILGSDRLHGYRRPAYGTNDTADAAATVDGQWSRIITPRESDLIRSLLVLPERRTTNSTRSLLGGLAQCGACGKTLVVGYDGKRIRRYVCRKTSTRQGCGNGIAADRLDSHIGVLMRRQQADSHPANEENHPADEAVLLWPAVAEATTARADAITRFASGLADLDTYRHLHGLLQEASTLLSQAAVERAPFTALGWDDLGLPERRRAIQRHVHITVNPSGRNGRFDPERIVATRHDRALSRSR